MKQQPTATKLEVLSQAKADILRSRQLYTLIKEFLNLKANKNTEEMGRIRLAFMGDYPKGEWSAYLPQPTTPNNLKNFLERLYYKLLYDSLSLKRATTMIDIANALLPAYEEQLAQLPG